MSLNLSTYLRLGLQTILHTNATLSATSPSINIRQHDTNIFDEVINFIITMLPSVIAVVALAVPCFSAFTSTAKIVPHTLQLHLLLHVLVLAFHVNLCSGLLEKTPAERTIDWHRIVLAVTTLVLLCYTPILDSWDYIRFRRFRSDIPINELSAGIFGLLCLANLLLVDYCFRNKYNLEGVILFTWLTYSTLLFYHVCIMWLTKWKPQQLGYIQDVSNSSELNLKIATVSEEKLMNTRKYEVDENGVTHPLRELLGIGARPTLEDREQGARPTDQGPQDQGKDHQGQESLGNVAVHDGQLEQGRGIH